MTKPNKCLSIQDFVDIGYLQEINRLVLHPAGLALAVYMPRDDEESLGEFRIYDAREDPEGYVFGENTIDRGKHFRVAEEIDLHAVTRKREFGWVVQPIPEEKQ